MYVLAAGFNGTLERRLGPRRYSQASLAAGAEGLPLPTGKRLAEPVQRLLPYTDTL
jgi:hypothetical protein